MPSAEKITTYHALLSKTGQMDDADVVRAIEENAAELLMAMGAAGGGSQRVDDVAEWTIGGSPLDYHNAVVRASSVEVVAESLAELKKHGVPGCWHVGPSMPIDGAALTGAGFVSGGSEPGMAVGIPELIAPRAVPGLSLTRVEDDEALAVWEATLGQGFGEGEREARWVASVYRSRLQRCTSGLAWLGCTS